MTQTHRLTSGGRIDRTKPLRFQFNGMTIEGFEGDTIASALLANGISLVGRSFKYHRPRGIFAHGVEEPNALVDVDRGPGRREPNVCATTAHAIDGMRVTSQNHWPSLGFDLGEANDLLAPFFPAGFYYKTFMWPRSFWVRFYEPLIRKIAGLGVAPSEPDADRYTRRYAHCDVLVVGGGPAGLTAALAASEKGKRVIVVDEQSEFGGALLHDLDSTIDGANTGAWLAQTLSTLHSRENVTVLPRTTAFGYYNGNYISLLERITDHLNAPSAGTPRQRLWQVRAKQVILATGSHERPLLFADNDRPGILLAESVRAYVNRYGVAPGKRLVIVTNGASAYRVAADAHAAGIHVTVVDVRPGKNAGPEVAMLRERGVEVLESHTVLGASGRKRVTDLIVAPVDANGRIGTSRRLACDCAGLSGGWTPAVHLFSQSRGKLRFDPTLDAFVPDRSAQSERSAGAAKGTYDLAACLEEGWRTGQAAGGLDASRTFSVTPKTFTGGAATVTLPSTKAFAGRRAFVDFQNDVSTKDIKLSVREGFESVEHVKRYTTTGMATDQGKTSNMVALAVLSEILERPVPQIGTTKFRPPYTPVTFGALAGPAQGELFDPLRRTPTDAWAVDRGAVFENFGLWRRASYFSQNGEGMRAATNRECKAVRTTAGIFDGSPLGKIEVTGPDATEFLNRLYVNDFTKLAIGKCAYGLMLKEDGYIFDDGVIARLADDRFHVTTTSGGAAGVFAHMEEYLQTEWPELRVFLTSITEQWGVVSVQGPKSREIIAPFVRDIDLANESFPHMSMRTGHILDIPTRLFRVSFTGELGYEINVPAAHLLTLWNAIYERGTAFGITPYGTESAHILRAERGFIAVGQETDGTVTPDDVGLSRMGSKKTISFVGKRSLQRPDISASGRKQLVGLLTENSTVVLDEGAQIVTDTQQSIPMDMIGHVTSSYWSETCGRSVALAMVKDGRALKDRAVYVTVTQGFTPARIVDPVFFDFKGERVHG